jgi:hypothetical protein
MKFAGSEVGTKAEADEQLHASTEPRVSSIESPTLVPIGPKPTAAPKRPQPISVPLTEAAPEPRPTKLNVGSIEEVRAKIANVSLN